MNIDNMNIFSTRDKQTAAFLITKKIHYLGLDSSVFPYVFRFDDRDGNCEELEKDYHLNQAEVPAKIFHESYIQLSREIERAKGNDSGRHR